MFYIILLLFLCLVTVAKFLDTMLNKRDKSSHPCLVLDIAGKALTRTLVVEFLVHAVNQAETVLLIPNLLKSFIMKAIRLYQFCFASTDMIKYFFSSLAYCCGGLH